jgi:hypothetical protein
MPWTFAHPAAVLPMRRFCPRHLHFAALVVGSLMPDFGYHFGLFALATYAHTLAGTLFACVPIGMALLICFSAVRRPLWHLLPQPHRDALEPLVAQPLLQGTGNIVRSSASIVLGAWSHIAWDSFTHRSGWSVAHIAALRSAVPVPWIGEVPLYNLLQHVSTLVGVLVLVLAYRSWLGAGHRTSFFAFARADRWRYATLLSLAIGCATIALLLAILGALPLGGQFSAQAFAFRLAVYGAVLFIGSTVLAAMYAFRGPKAAPRSTLLS